MTPRAWHQYWLVPAFLALILMPTPWAAGLLLAAVAATLGIRIARAATASRTGGARAAAAALLGTDRSGKAVLLSDLELSAHGLILGASGAGKSTTLLRILTEQIARGRPVVAIDMKGSPAFARVLEDAATAAGRPFTCWTLDGPAHWNPLQYGNATELKDKLITTERFSEPHYKRAAERYVQMVLKVLGEAHPGRPPDLLEVVRLMDPHRLPSVLRHVSPGLREHVQDYLAGMTADQLSAVRGLETRLAVVTESHTGAYLAPPRPDPLTGTPGAMIDLREALRGSEVVVFSLNASRYGQLAAQIGTLVVQDLVSASGERLGEILAGRQLETAMVGIDEFSGLNADQVSALVARSRESGLCALVATQEMVDLDRASPGLRDQVIGVTALKIVHRQEVPRSARMVAEMAGTAWVWEETRQRGSRLLVGYDTGRGTRRQVERFIVDPNEIQNLPRGEAVVISKLRGGRARTVHGAAPRRAEPPELGR